jgi:ATP-dependent Clp protease adaptor protein ClpS
MAKKKEPKATEQTPEGGTGGGGGSAEGTGSAVKAKPKKEQKPKRRPPEFLPPYKVLLHNDDKNDMKHVIESIVELTPLDAQEAEQRMEEAHKTGVALLLVTHKERAELYQEQFQSKSLVVTIEPAE